MNGSLAANDALVRALVRGHEGDAGCAVAVCVPAPYLAQVQMLRAGTPLELGAQDVSEHARRRLHRRGVGRHAQGVRRALRDRRSLRAPPVPRRDRRRRGGQDQGRAGGRHHARSSASGETLAQREAGRTEDIVKRQMAAVIHTNGHCISEIVVAYEPVWAIGTGQHRHARAGAAGARRAARPAQGRDRRTPTASTSSTAAA